VGATEFRTSTAARLAEQIRPAIIRGNASEIRALASGERGTRGVDSAHASEDAVDAARALVSRYGCVAVVSGEVDVVVSAESIARVFNGDAMMPRVTGLGCTATALIGAFAAVNPSPRDAALNAMAVMGVAGEIAACGAKGPGMFLTAFMDALYNLSEADVRSRLKVEE
jgi:hydroxyethylthiazole kinase